MVETARRRAKYRDGIEATTSDGYSSKIIKAGALLADTKTLLAHWNTAVPAQVNLDRLRHDNVFGKASRSRVEDILAIFRQRYLGEERVTKALVALAQKRLAAASLDRILYFHAAQADRLLHDTVSHSMRSMVDRARRTAPGGHD